MNSDSHAGSPSSGLEVLNESMAKKKKKKPLRMYLKKMEAHQQKCNLSERKRETAAAAAAGGWVCFFFLLRWSTGADAALAFHPTFPQGHCSVCVEQQKEGGGGEQKKKGPGSAERDSLPSAQT